MDNEPTKHQLSSWYAQMVRIRKFEEKVQYLFKRGRLPGFVHLCAGQEATAVGACSVLGSGDRIASTHRGHGHLIAKGADVDRMMAELFGRSTGYCKGKGGSMHIADFSLGILGANGIVGAGIPIATGAAMADQVLDRSNVTIVFFGDGASNQGVLYEALNLSAVWKLPIIFFCENNLYSEWSRAEDLTSGRIADRGNAFGVPGIQVDGNDLLAVREQVGKAATRARVGEGPTLIEALTYRLFAHNEGEEAFSGTYRPADEVAAWRDRDPLALFRTYLETQTEVTSVDLDELEQEEGERIEGAVRFAESSAFPSPEAALDDLYAERSL